MLFIHHTEAAENISLIEIKGPLDTATSADFEVFVNRLLDMDKRYFVIDAREMEYASSAGIGVLLHIQKRLSAMQGALSVCALPAETTALFNLLGFDKTLALAGSREEAISMLQQRIESPEEFATDASPAPRIESEEAAHIGPAGEDISAHALESIGEGTEPVTFVSPLVVECAQCRGLVRVKHNGVFQCPHCHTEFSVERDQTIIF